MYLIAKEYGFISEVKTMQHIYQAIYSVVHNSNISVQEIADLMGIRYQTLVNKANPRSDTHNFTFLETIQLQLVTGNSAINRAIDIELKRNQADSKESKQNLLESVLSASKEHGDVVRVIQEAIEDGRFTSREQEQCQQEIDEAIKELNALRLSVVAQGT